MLPLSFLLPALAPYRRRLLAGSGWLVLTNLFGALLPWLLQVGIDAIEAQKNQTLIYAAVGLALVAAVRGGTRLLSRYAFLHSARAAEIDLRREMLQGLLDRPMSFFDRERTGDLLSRFTSDLSGVRMLAGFGLLTLINAFLVYLITLTMLLRLSPSLTFLALIPYPLMFLIVRRMSRRMFVLSTRMQESLGRVSESVEESVTGETVVRALALGDQRQQSFDRANQECLAASLDLSRLRALIMPVMTVVGPLGALIALYCGGRMVADGTFSLGELVAFTAYLGQLVWPTLTVGWVLTLVQRAAANMERIDAVRSRTAPPAAPTVDLQAPAVSISQLDFAYGDGPQILHDVTLDIPAGQVCGIVGPTGSGKSTLLRLTAGLYPAPDRAVQIDGRPPAAAAGRIVAVPQEGRLFSGTIRDNLFYGVDQQSDVELQAIAAAVALDREIASFADGYETRVGEGGIAISGGQRQRVCLGRALARDGGLWLLDDPLSHLDAGTARTVWENLRRHLAGRTVLITSSRISLLRSVDTICLLDSGRIVACGRHDELLQRSPLYARLAEEERLRDELESLQ